MFCARFVLKLKDEFMLTSGADLWRTKAETFTLHLEKVTVGLCFFQRVSSVNGLLVWCIFSALETN